MDNESAAVPLLRRAGPSEIAAEIERVKALAEEVNLGTLAYLLDIALIEARHQQRQRERDARDRGYAPDETWTQQA